MTANTTLLRDASDYILRRFEAPEGNVQGIYHDLTHTRETVETGVKIAEGMGLSEEERAVVVLACWFHDIGYLESSGEHERKSADIAEAFLRERGADPDTIESVRGCILATKIPQNPRNLPEQIVCDADLSHLGSTDYFRKNKLLRDELEKNARKTFTRSEWLRLNIDFFRNHEFFTAFARQQFNEGKTRNLILLYEELAKKKTGKKKSDKDKKKAGENRGVERNMEVYYRTSSRNHVSFSAIVDQKANIMIQTNSLIFSIIISLLVRKLDQLPDLIIPTFIMLFTCVATIITSVMATRPKVTRHETSKQDILDRKANLLFFGSFVNLDLDQYEWGVREMLADKPYYIANMIRDTYFLGRVLDRKYRYLRISYDIFMVGLVISISLYAYAFFT